MRTSARFTTNSWPRNANIPTHEELARFLRDYQALPLELRLRFLAALPAFRDDLDRGAFRTGFRVKRVNASGADVTVWEMSFAPDGRATFHFGSSPLAGRTHVVWRRIGTHDIFRNP